MAVPGMPTHPAQKEVIMSKREHVEKQSAKTEKAETTEVEAKNVKNEELAQETDDLLDEIDEVLEINAEEFVAGYVQKGGQ